MEMVAHALNLMTLICLGPVNEYQHCAHDIYNGNVIEREEEACTT